jgi:hypothetical protein
MKRLTVTVDPSLVDAGLRAVKAGRADSLSGWVNDALVRQAEHERGLAGLTALIAAYEKKHGVITDAELAAQARADRANAVVVRGRPKRRRAA